MNTITFAITDLLCCGDDQALEQKLKLNPHISDASVNFVTQTATITYHEEMINEEELKKMVADCDFQCQDLPLLSGKEALKISEHKLEMLKPKEINHTKMDHSKLKQDMREMKGHDMTKMSHKDHEKAMTDPRMAAFMENDMKNRFLWSLLFSIPIFLYSPVFTDFLKIKLPTPIPHNWLLFLLTTPVIFKFGSIFPIGAWRAIKNKTLNMMVLIATGVFAAYIFSVFITLFVGGETFFEAAALLVTFVLFGHWMEMKSRRGTSEALRALFDMVPPQARIMRSGKEIEVNSSEVIKDDMVVIRPGNKIPVDGEVIEGETYIDEALVTGESLPVHKTIGSQVVGRTINQNGSIRF